MEKRIYTILIVEDDPQISSLLGVFIRKYGYKAVEIQDFSQVMESYESSRADMVLMDIHLPTFDGFYWCRQIRKQSLCPILFISANDSHMDQIMALENGADDYITKPFHYEVVIAKINSYLRRVYGAYAVKQEERKVEAGNLVFYPERYTAVVKDASVELTVKEAILLETLLGKVGRVVRRDRLLDAMWEDHHFIDDNTLNVYVTRVRNKLKEIGANFVIETVRGAGYRVTADAEGEP